ncbi:MAG TPA: histidine kinase [Pseudonocardiaceae bacterium]|nr:histidine kinase [Pseudonocardiaceae bacterium]
MSRSSGATRSSPTGHADEEPGDVPGGDQKPEVAWNLARATLTVVFCASGLVALLEVYQSEPDVVRTIVAALLMGGLLAIQLFHFSRPGADLHSRRSYPLLGLLACLAYIPLVEYGFSWISLPPFLAGCVLLALPPAAAWTSFAAIMASIWWIRVALHESTITVAYGVLNAVFFGLIVYLLTRLASLVDELHDARGEMAQMAVAEERLRFARDLHDLLGLSLSAITLKGELTHRLMAKYPERAKQELTEILDIARRALADVRSAASGYRELSLNQEAKSAESVLKASDVDVHMELEYTDLPAHIRTMLGMVLREGVTNVLRHSKAEHCDIVIRQAGRTASLDILNDGVVDPPSTRDPDSGSGIRNLSERVAKLGGTVVTEVQHDNRFRLHAQVPLPAPAADQPRTPGDRPADRHSPAETRSTLPLNAKAMMLMVNIVFSGIAALAMIHLVMLDNDFWTDAAGIGYLAALLALQLAYFGRSTTRLRTPQGYALLFVQGCLIFLPLLQQGTNWVSLPGWLGGNALLVLPPVAGWVVFLGSVGSVIWSHVISTGDSVDITFNAASVVITGLIAFGLTSLTKLIAELDTTRKQLASMAVAEERLRFARDLHDLLGLSVSAITLKCELTNRLLDAYPAQAAEELTEILSLARQALADVRSVASGYRELSFDKESHSAQSVLTAADVVVRMDLDYDELPIRVRTVLAVVLREGVTNVLRHSRARHCDIVMRQETDRVSLAIVNDGVHVDGEVDGTALDGALVGAPSSGIRNLSERVAKLGGELDCGEVPAGRFQLRVNLPI